MPISLRHPLCLTTASLFALSFSACTGGSATESTGSETDSGESQGDADTTGTETGSEGSSESGESGESTESGCVAGSEACECGPDQACFDGLECVDDVCTPVVAECGNGVVEGDEECDDANADEQDGCLSTCLLPFCGDGVVHTDEECDDGNTNDDDGCSNSCVALPFCGDGIEVEGELCFDEPLLMAAVGVNDALIADITNDGTLDVVAVGSPAASTGNIVVFEGRGDGTFHDPDSVELNNPGEDNSFTRAEVGDFELDPYLDLAVFMPGAAGPRVLIYRGTGASQVHLRDETLAAVGSDDALGLGVVRMPSGSLAADYAVGFRDATVDCIAAEWFEFNDAQTLADMALVEATVSKLCTATTVAVVVGNFIGVGLGDTDPEVVLVQSQSDSAIFHAQPDLQAPGTELANESLWLMEENTSPTAAVAADINADGASDLLFATWDSVACDYSSDESVCAGDYLGVAMGAAIGTTNPFMSETKLQVLGKATVDIATGDLNNDGDVDFLSANSFGAAFTIGLGDGAGSFAGATDGPVLTEEKGNAVDVGDLNGDGRPDFIVAQQDQGHVAVFLSNP